MATLYERPEIYDLLENEQKYAMTREHWETVFAGLDVHSVLDVSIGSGTVTLPLLDMGMEVYGSDLSQAMLDRCRAKAEARGHSIDLRACDFRELAGRFDRTFDCVMSSGNALAYVPNGDVPGVIAQMAALVKPGGYVYFDTRNWDKILAERPRFYTYNPNFVDSTRINLVQVWDYLPDGAMDFNLLFTFEKENRIVQRETFVEHYYPLPRELLLAALRNAGCSHIRQMPYPTQFTQISAEDASWYCVLAKKDAQS